MKTILGLDLGTNSIGWALVQQNFDKKEGKILGMGSRIIPMSQDILSEFEKGNSISQTAERTRFRSIRRLKERNLLRRERLHRVLNIMNFLPEHYSAQIDFQNHPGKFIDDSEPKLAYKTVFNNLKVKNENVFFFKESFDEMLKDFQKYQPQILVNKTGKQLLVPYDWTLYYLRKKALTNKISKEELSWIILNFNQKRGYYQLRGEEDDTNNKIEYVISQRVSKIEKGEQDKKNNQRTWYNIILENGWIYSATFTSEPLWLNSERDFLIIEELDENGELKIIKDKKTDKNGKPKRRITPLPSFEEIDLLSKAEQDKIYKKIKAKTESTIAESDKTVGEYIYESLLLKPNQKIRGKLIRTIERKFYKDELRLILLKQKEFHKELQNSELYSDCIRELYKNNLTHQQFLSSKDIVHLLLEDIIFYQRPLKSQKSSISNCPLEFRKFRDENGIEQIQHLKVISKSNPYYQEFRIWQWMYNLSVYRREDDSNVTHEFLNSLNDWENLYEFLSERKEVDQKALIKHLLEMRGIKNKASNSEIEKYRWNYVEDKKYPCNETGVLIRTRMEKVMGKMNIQLTSNDYEHHLWHIIYSINDKVEYEKALKSFAEKKQLNVDIFVEAFKRFPPFKSEYGAFSEKAIKKLLPLMRLGKYWNWNNIDKVSAARIEKIISGEDDETIKLNVREFAKPLKEYDDFQGLQIWLVQYIVYGRHSEAAVAGKWNSADDLAEYLRNFKQHSLRNPIVEQVVTETLRVVKDIWIKYGGGKSDFLNEIHIELGRQMKNTADDRKKITDQILQNENTSLRIKSLLAEMLNDGKVENVRPYSPMQQEILKVYEDGVLNSDLQIEEDILKISKTAQPTPSELRRYKLWLEQKYRSPYTGEIIPLNKLFTHEYEIEHIIPQSRYFDDSFSNKVICESAVNKLKDNQLGFEFIKNHHGEKILINNKNVQIFDESTYLDFVKIHYAKNRSKRNKLLLEDIPEKMIERQLNDTRYISKFISSVLSNIVRTETNDDGINSKNLIPGNGKITNELKKDWGLNDVWNDIILPRFDRLNKLTNTTHFTTWNENHQKFLPTVPLELTKNFSKKRIDHRHHAMDALVIACATRDHINLLNNKYAKSKERFDLNRKLREYKKVTYLHPNTKEIIEKVVPDNFLKPWNDFTRDAKSALEGIIVSFKQNLRVINKATNYYEGWSTENEKIIKSIQAQKGTNWAIRKSLHKDTVSGKVNLNWVKPIKDKVVTATRKSLNSSFDLKSIESITDTGIQKILKLYLASKNGNPEIAFSPEGIEELNNNIQQYNDGKDHQPILKARVYEVGSKFPLGQTGNKQTKYVEAAKGTNLFFGIYGNSEGKRYYETIPLNTVIERQKQGLPTVPLTNEKSCKLLFFLSPNDLIYIPAATETNEDNSSSLKKLNKEQIKNIYKIVSFTGNRLSVIPYNVAVVIANKVEYTQLNKIELIKEKEVCIKINIDRLGNIIS